MRQDARRASARAPEQALPTQADRRPRTRESSPRFCCLLTSVRCLHLCSVEMSGINDLSRQGPANAFMNTPGHSIPGGCRIEVEGALVAPMMHDRQPIKEHDAALLGHPTHNVGERGYTEH